MATSVERSQRGVKRVLDKLENSIAAGNYYEAHQMYRTLFFRYNSQQKYTECLELLWNGAKKLQAKQQDSSAVDLAMLLIETLEHIEGMSDEVGRLWISRLGSFIKNINVATVDRENFINVCIKWSGEMSGRTQGHPLMHKYVAHLFWSEGNMELARYHCLLCQDGQLCGRLLIKLHTTKGYLNEVDLFIVQAVLQQLCLKDTETAEVTFQTYTTHHPQIRRSRKPFKQPLLNFLAFLLLTLQSKRYEAFRTLCDVYKLSLQRDSSFDKYLSKIAVLYFGVQPPNPMGQGGGFMGGVFGDMFMRLFQGLDDDNNDSDDQQQQQQQQQQTQQQQQQQSGQRNSTSELD